LYVASFQVSEQYSQIAAADFAASWSIPFQEYVYRVIGKGTPFIAVWLVGGFVRGIEDGALKRTLVEGISVLGVVVC
jgi:hypothetical protein